MTMELNILGTASQLPTADRNHGGYVLRWRGQTVLLDPGEGVQRQCILSGLSVPAVRTICISHFHGDHCLGLPGIIQRLALARISDPITLIYPREGESYLSKLLTCSEFHNELTIRKIPVSGEGVVCHVGELRIEAIALRHRILTYGFRIVNPGGLRFDKDKLTAAGIQGKSVGILQEKGELQTEKSIVSRESLSRPVPDKIFAYVADTSPGEHLNTLMHQADIVLCETTFMKKEADIAEHYDHLTTETAAKTARKNDVQYLVATHFSERYRDTRVIEQELRDFFPRSYAAQDLSRYSLTLKTGSLEVETIRKKNE